MFSSMYITSRKDVFLKLCSVCNVYHYSDYSKVDEYGGMGSGGGLRVKQNLLEPECLVSMERNRASSTMIRNTTSSGPASSPRNITPSSHVQIQAPVGMLRRDSALSGNGMSLMSTSGKQGIENCYYEHFILDYRVQSSNVSTVLKSNNTGGSPGTDRMSADPGTSMKPRKTKFPAMAFFSCEDCGRCYRSKTSLGLHKRLECGKEPTFQCPYCPLKTHQKGNLNVHIKKKHLKSAIDDPQNDRGHPHHSEGSGQSENLQQ